MRSIDSVRGLLVIAAVAVVIRVLLAPHFGFYGDLRYFRIWADRMRYTGLKHFYDPATFFCDYPPGYLYILSVIGKFQHSPGYSLLKLPMLLGDLALAWTSALLAFRLAPQSLRGRLPVRALVFAGALFNPAVLGIGAVWGQVDSVPAALVIGGLLLLLTGTRTVRRDAGALTLVALAVAMKPQSAFLAPVLAYLLVRRYLIEPKASDKLRGLGNLALVTGASFAMWAVSGLPFGMGPGKVLKFYNTSARTYPVTSANAFNFWGLINNFRRDSKWGWGNQPTVQKVFGIPAQRFGFLAFGIGLVLILWLTHRAITRGHNQAIVILAAAAGVNLVAYTVLTRMHERYMFPVLACLAPLAVWKGFRAAYWTLSTLFVLNLWFPLALYNGQWNSNGNVGRVYGLRWRPVFEWFFGDNIDAPNSAQRRFWSFLVVVVMIAFIAAFRHNVRTASLGMPNGGTPLAVSKPESATTRSAVDPPTRGITDSETPPRSALQFLGTVRSVLAVPETTVPARRDRLAWMPYAVVAATCAFCLAALRGELRLARTVNDNTFHFQMVRWATRQLDRGRLPLDGWFPDLTLGSSFFHHYQSLPYTATAVIGRTLHVTPRVAFLWIGYLLLALWPISVYLSTRLLGWGRWVAASAAALSPLLNSVPGYGYEHNSYTYQGWGVFTQLWGMWLFPLALGLTWRAVTRKRGYWMAALAIALTIATHLMTGYLLLLCLPLLGLLARKNFVQRLGRVAAIAAASLVTASWVLVPLLADQKYSAQSYYYKGTLYNDSFGARQILRWLVHGEMYDRNRLPIITLLGLFGLIVCLLRFRTDERARVIVCLWVLTLMVYFGRVTWKGAIDLLPGAEDLQMHRFVVGMQMAGIVLAAVGLAALGNLVLRGVVALLATARKQISHPIPTVAHLRYAAWAVVAVLGVLVLRPAWQPLWRYDRSDVGLAESQRYYDSTDGRNVDALISIVKERNDGRVYAGTRANWGANYKVGFVPVLQMASHNDADGIGFTFRTVQSMSTDIEVSFDENNLADYEALNVKYVILPKEGFSGVPAQPTVPATIIAEQGNYRLFEIPTTGYFQVVDRIGSIRADRKTLLQATSGFRGSKQALQGVYPAIEFGDGNAPPNTIDERPASQPGYVVQQSNERDNGVFSASVFAARRATVLLKASYDPRWRVTVDGESADTVMMAPSLVGVDVGPGEHEIRFSYRSYPHYPLLITAGVLVLLTLGLWPRRGQVLVYAQRVAGRLRPRPGR